MTAHLRPRVICVDDEPHVAGGLSLHLRRRYDVEIATSAQAGLDALARRPAAAVVISDMRMPGMNGAEFLARACASHPETTRILLTGYAEMEAAVAAINEGQVFRFLVKPCPPPTLLATVDAAAELHRVIVAEKLLLEKTLHGSVKMLTEVLAITNPVAFGRASRLKKLVSEIADRLNETDRWQAEVAAMLSQLATITLPAETAEKLYYGGALTVAEQQMVDRAPDITTQLVGHIPRLEGVREMLARHTAPFRPRDASSREEAIIQRGTQILKVAAEFDTLEAQGLSTARALEAMKGRADQYDPRVLSALVAACGDRPNEDTIREISIGALKPGMVLATDVTLTSGALFVARGYEVTESFLERLKNLRAGSIKGPVRVLIRGDAGG
jgi:response regulator RpfG family c-di-GMP phosphodiesterase